MDGSAGERAEGPSGGSSKGDGAGRQGKRQGKRQRQDKPHNLRGDVIRKVFERRGSGNVAERAESYTDYVSRLKQVAAYINDNYNVDNVCHRLPDKVIDAKGDRIAE